MNKFLKILIVIGIAIGLILIFNSSVQEYKEKKKYEFSVNSLDGKVTKESFKGKALAVYFGYTYCPDVCPTSLSNLASALDGFSKEQIKDFAGIFISVDPNRDTLKSLKEYSGYFHLNFIGATSDKKNIDNIVKRYGSHYEKVVLEDSAMGYSVAHTSYIYLFDKNGKFVEKIDHFFDANKIKESLEKVLRKE